MQMNPSSSALFSQHGQRLRCASFPSRTDRQSLTPRDWADAVAKQHGMRCHARDHGIKGAELRAWSLGDINALEARVGGCRITPASDSRDAFPENSLILKIFIEGSAVLEQAGKTSRVMRGALVLIDPSQDFEEIFEGDVHISTLVLPKRLLKNRGVPSTINGHITPDMSQPEMMFVRDMLYGIIRHSAHVSTEFAERLQKQVLDFIDVIIAASGPSIVGSGRHVTLYRARDYMRRNFADPDLDPDTIGAALQLSSNYLNKLFRSEGTSLMRYLWSLRLEQAALQLRNGPGRRVDQIAYACGFSSAAHFSRTFRARYGLTPSEMRHLA